MLEVGGLGPGCLPLEPFGLLFLFFECPEWFLEFEVLVWYGTKPLSQTAGLEAGAFGVGKRKGLLWD